MAYQRMTAFQCDSGVGWANFQREGEGGKPKVRASALLHSRVSAQCKEETLGAHLWQ